MIYKGKSTVAANLMKNFITQEECPIYNPNFQTPKVVYVTLSNQNGQKMKKFMENSSINSNFTIFTANTGASLLEKFLLPFSAMKFAKDLQNKNNDVLFVFDDAFEHFYKENHLFTAMHQPFVRIYGDFRFYLIFCRVL